MNDRMKSMLIFINCKLMNNLRQTKFLRAKLNLNKVEYELYFIRVKKLSRYSYNHIIDYISLYFSKKI
jgi:hypothetical protein